MHSHRFDKTDIRLLEILQQRGRTKRNTLSEDAHLSIPTISERLRKLEECGVIRSYNAILDAKTVNLGVTAFIFVITESSTHYADIIKHATEHEEVQECHAVTGDGSHLLKVRTQNTSTLERLLSQIQTWPGVKNTRTSIVLSSPKETTILPLNQLLEQIKDE